MSSRLVATWAHAIMASAQSIFRPSPMETESSSQHFLLTMERLATLPTAVLAHIFAYADGDFVTEWYPLPPQLPVELFATLTRAGVMTLQPVIKELEASFNAIVVHFEFDISDMEAFGHPADTRLITRLEQSAGRIQCLQLGLEMLEYRRNFEVVKARTYAETFDHVAINWDSIFALCPTLRRLDLSGLPLRSTHLPHLLHAAGTHCHALQSLVLPDKEWYRGPVGMDGHHVMQALYAALKQWHRANGGLRQLTIPHRTTHPDNTVTRQTLANELVLAIAAFCPHLEHFDGWKVSLREVEGVLRCDERLHCSLDAWQVFCQSCPKLQEIHWSIFPFVDAYFQHFAAVPRPHLRKVTLATNANSFPGALEDDEHDNNVPRGCSATSVFQAIAACPSLEEFSILLQEELTEPGRVPTEHMVNDTLVETLVKNCPNLQQLEILQAESGGCNLYTRDHNEHGLTDQAFQQLALLPHLRVLHINVGSHCDADGLLALVTTSPRVGVPREIELVVGLYHASAFTRSPSRVPPPKTCIQFHTVLLEFLALLVMHKETVEGRRFKLRIHNGSSLYVDEQETWQRELEVIVAELRIHCPQLQLHLVRQGGIAGVTLSQGSSSTGSITGIQPTYRHLWNTNTQLATDWTTVAWYATMQALAVTAVVSYTAATRMA